MMCRVLPGKSRFAAALRRCPLLSLPQELQTELTNLRAQLLQTKTALETRSEQQQSQICATAGQRQAENSSAKEVKRLKEEVAGLREDVEGLEEDLRDKDGRLHRLREELAAAKKELRQKGKVRGLRLSSPGKFGCCLKIGSCL